MPFSNPRPLKALIVDVDGTLYDQTPVRAGIVRRLLRTYMTHPVEGLSTCLALRAYRKAQETLRLSPDVPSIDVATAQILLAAKRTGLASGFITTSVARWVHQEPLDLIARARRPGLLALLHGLKARHVRVAALSDYPAVAKLDAMDILPFFHVVITAQDPDVQAFKPSPRGLRVALSRVGVMAHEALYVGDRVDIDAPTAAGAGVRCVIIGRPEVSTASEAWTPLLGYRELGDALGCDEESPDDSEKEAHEIT